MSLGSSLNSIIYAKLVTLIGSPASNIAKDKNVGSWLQGSAELSARDPSRQAGLENPQKLVDMATARESKPRGPRTALGKERSRNNALTHGLFSKAVVLEGEPQGEYQALLDGLRKHFRPEGALEEGYVELLAAIRWRQRRYHVAEIEAGRTFLEWDEKRRVMAEAEAVNTPVSRHPCVLTSKIENPEVLDMCIASLQVVRNDIENAGINFERDSSLLVRLYGRLDRTHWQFDLLVRYKILAETATPPPDSLSDPSRPTPERCKKELLALVDAEIEKFVLFETDQKAVASRRLKLEALRQNVPTSPRLDSLLRYWTALERSFERNLMQLERAQRVRFGQPVIPRLEVDVSTS
jgi:hypothetical protein